MIEEEERGQEVPLYASLYVRVCDLLQYISVRMCPVLLFLAGICAIDETCGIIWIWAQTISVRVWWIYPVWRICQCLLAVDVSLDSLCSPCFPCAFVVNFSLVMCPLLRNM